MDLETRVVIHPFNLTDEIKTHISNHIQMKCCGVLTKDGYVKSINHISEINKGKITSASNGSVVYNVKFNANVYKIEKGEIIKAIIRAVTMFGVYCDGWDAPSGVAVFLLPKSEIDKEEELKENDVIFLKVEDLRIKKNEYLCVCSKAPDQN